MSAPFDLLVVGGGIAGLSAANRATQRGLRVAVLEKGVDELYPCNSRVAGGVLHISYQNLSEPKDALVDAMQQITAGAVDRSLAEALAGDAPRAVQWLVDEGAKLDRSGKVNWRQWLLAPTRPAVNRLEWKGHGSDLTLRRLASNFAERGGTLVRGARVVALTMEEGACVGVTAERDGKRERLRAGSVLLADGGYQANPELLRRHVTARPDALKQRCMPSATGDGLRMAQAIGAATTDLGVFYGHLISRDAMTNDDLWPYPQIDELAACGILVDGEGRRFADEGMGGVFLANAVAHLADPLTATAVFDARIWEGPGRAAAIPPNPRLAETGGTIHSAATVAELAGRLGMQPAVLEETVRGYNEAIAAGRGDGLPVRRTGTRHAPSALAQAPFYGIPIAAGITFTMGGIVIDRDGRVLRADREPIPGLYAAGSTTGGLDGGAVCGYVGGLIKSLVFGLRVGEHVSRSQHPA